MHPQGYTTKLYSQFIFNLNLTRAGHASFLPRHHVTRGLPNGLSLQGSKYQRGWSLAYVGWEASSRVKGGKGVGVETEMADDAEKITSTLLCSLIWVIPGTWARHCLHCRSLTARPYCFSFHCTKYDKKSPTAVTLIICRSTGGGKAFL